MFSSFVCSRRDRHELKARLNAVHLTDRMCGWPSSGRHAYTGFPEQDFAFYWLQLHGLERFLATGHDLAHYRRQADLSVLILATSSNCRYTETAPVHSSQCFTSLCCILTSSSRGLPWALLT